MSAARENGQFIVRFVMPKGLFTVDVYRTKLKATPSLIEFATFVLFDRQLMAGPIVRAEEFWPQIADPPPIRDDHAAQGMLRVVTVSALARALSSSDPFRVENALA